jgi:hypothetical protein
MREMMRFEKVSITGEKTGKCLCGIRRTRKRVFTQTLNPWNKNEKGEISSRNDILNSLQKEREKWLKEEIYCKKCDMPDYWSMTKEQREFYKQNGKKKTIEMFFKN